MVVCFFCQLNNTALPAMGTSAGHSPDMQEKVTSRGEKNLPNENTPHVNPIYHILQSSIVNKTGLQRY